MVLYLKQVQLVVFQIRNYYNFYILIQLTFSFLAIMTDNVDNSQDGSGSSPPKRKFIDTFK